MKANQLWDVWSSLTDEKKARRVYFGPMVEKLGEAEFHPVLDVYVDESNEEIIIQYGETASCDLSDNREGLTGNELLSKLRDAMKGREEFWVEASASGPQVEGEMYLRVDFPIRQCGGYGPGEVMLLMH